MSLRFILYCLLFFSLSNLCGQSNLLNVIHYGEEEGLSHRSTSCVFQDRDGFVWIATQDGLNRFDGYQFKFWNKEQLRLNNSDIQALGQDDEGWLWIKNFVGGSVWEFVFFNPYTEEVLTLEDKFPEGIPLFLDDKNEGYWATHSRFPIPNDQEGRLIFGTVHPPIHLYTYRSDEGFLKYKVDQLQQLVIHLIDDRGFIWGSDHGNIVKLSPKGEVLKIFPFDDFNSVDWIQQVGQDIFFEGYWASEEHPSDHRLFKISAASIPTQVQLGNSFDGYYCNPYLSSILTYKNKEETYQLFDLNSQQLISTLTKEELPHIAFFRWTDQYGKMWGTSQFGLYQLNFQDKKFKTYFSFSDETAKLFNNSARGIYAFGDTLMVNFEFTGTRFIDKRNEKWWPIDFPSSRNYWPRPIYKNKNHQLLIGNTGTLLQYDLNQNLVHEIPQKGDPFLLKIWSIYEDKNALLWLGLENNGLAYFCGVNNDSICSYVDPKNPNLELASINSFIEDQSTGVWLCSNNGLFLFEPSNKRILAYYNSKQSGNNYLPADNFYHLHQDAAGIYWIATSNGLIKWNKTSGEHQRFSRKDGLSDNNIYAVFEDDHQHLWMSSDNGIMQFNKESHVIRNYLPKEGISHHEFNRTAHFKDSKGRIYFGGLNGVTSFHPDDFYNPAHALDYNLVISDFKQFDSKANQLINRTKDIRTTKRIVMKPKDSFFQMTLALLTYEDVDLVQYAYQINGTNKDWILLEDEVLRLGRLSYGNHTLHVKGRTSAGNWSQKKLAIQIEVLKPFYLQYWFISLMAFCLLLLGWAYNNFRTRRLKIEQKKLEEKIQLATQQIQSDKKTIEDQAEELRQLDKVKSRFFANVSHELRTPLTLMLGPISSVVKNNKLGNRDFTLLKKAQQSGKELLKLISSILDLSKLESSKMELQETPVPLFKFTRRIASAFESHAQTLGISFAFDYRAENQLQLELDPQKLEVILNNLLSNAMKFTQAGGKVNFTIKDVQNAIQMEIVDTGRGIHPDDLPNVFNRFYQSTQADAPTEGGTGIGLALSLEFAKMMNGTIEVESEFGQGSTFIVKLPRKEVMGLYEPIEKEVQDTPIANHHSEQNQSIRSTASASSSADCPTIMIVEDNHSLRDYISTILSPHYLIVTAQNGLIALDKLQENQSIQLIISDIMMPEMDGFQLVNILKSKNYYRHLPMIMLTARADIKDKLKALRIGVDDYLLKPFEEEELLVRIENLLRNYENRMIDLTKADQDALPNASTSVEAAEQVNEEDQVWLESLETHLQTHLSDAQYSIRQLAYDQAISERQLRRRLKSLTGLSPTQYFKEIRLQNARKMLEERRFKTIAQTAIAVGFQDPGAFSRNFRQRFGKAPSDFE